MSVCVAVCVGVGGDHVITSTDPTDRAIWNAARVDAHDLRMVSCPSEALCVAIDRSGDVLTSSAPTRGASAWSVSAVTPGQELTDVACPSMVLCVATGYPSGILISTNPAGGPAAWASLSNPAGQGYPDHVACPSVSTCVAVSNEGLVSWLAIDSSGRGHWGRDVEAPWRKRGGGPVVPFCQAVRRRRPSWRGIGLYDANGRRDSFGPGPD